MKKAIVAMLFVIALVLSGCAPATRYAQTGIKALEPCLWLIATQAPQDEQQACLSDAVTRVGSVALVDLMDYLATIPRNLVNALYEELDTTQGAIFSLQVKDNSEQVAKLLLEKIEQTKTPDPGAFLAPMFGIAYAQETSVTDATLETDPYTWIQTIGLAIAMVTITAFLRTNFLPKLSGLWVPLLAIGVGLGIKYLVPLIPSNIFNDIANIVLIAVGGGGGVDLWRNAGKQKDV
jgi:hypothetical protein